MFEIGIFSAIMESFQTQTESARKFQSDRFKLFYAVLLSVLLIGRGDEDAPMFFLQTVLSMSEHTSRYYFTNGP